MDLESQLRATPATGDARPSVLDLSRAQDEATLSAILDGKPTIVDTIDDQLRELAAATRRDERAIFEGAPRWRYGRWVHYPWSQRLVHVLPPAEFRRLRSDRNRHRITADEQAQLSRARIAVVGLSVGRAIATTLALEGVGAAFKLADFDTLSLSNLNRILAPLDELGGNKAILCARQLYEIDPFLDVEVFARGIDDATLEPFLDGIDLVIEECDDLYTKVKLREAARRRRLPVVMHTTEGGILDVERFDREPERALFHGAVPEVSAAALRDLPTKEKVPFVLRILGTERMSTRARASLVEIGETLSTWPQLGSAVALGGGVVTDVARRILLGELTASGRFFVEPGELIRDERALTPAAPSFAVAVLPEAQAPRALPLELTLTSISTARIDVNVNSIGAAEARWLVEHAVLAPSGGNTQPWRFRFAGGRLDCAVDGERAMMFLDVDGLASRVALGAAVENIALAAARLGFAADVQATAEGARIEFRNERSLRNAPAALYEAIARRVTNRRRADAPRPLDAAVQSALAAAAAERGGRARFVVGRDGLATVGALVGCAERVAMFSPRMHRDLFGELRFSPDEIRRTRDGLDVATLEVGALDRAVLTILRDPAVPACLRALDAGAALTRPGRERMLASSAACLLTIDGDGDGDGRWLDGGRALERFWLTATTLGIGVHPEAMLPYLITRARRHPETLEARERDELSRLAAGLDESFGDTRGDALVLLMRLVVAAEPETARSLRRPVDDVLVTG